MSRNEATQTAQGVQAAGTDGDGGAYGGGGARILERGYRRYDGPRRGTARVVRSLTRHTIERVLGLRRPARSKVLPVLAITMAYLPAAVFIGLVAFIPEQARDLVGVPDYPEYYGFVTAAILLFVVLVAPEALCPDRRSGLIGLYLASPLTRSTYLLAKALAIASVLAFVTLGPLLLLLLGLSLQGAGPEGFGNLVVTLVRIVGAGLALTAFYTALSMAVASLTDRRAVASAATLLLLSATTIAAGVLVLSLRAPEPLALLSLNRVPFDAVLRIYGVEGLPPNLATPLVLGALVAWTLAGAAVVALRYRRLEVTR